MTLTVFEYIATGGIVFMLVLLWYAQRKLGVLLLQAINELGAMRAATEMAGRSYLGIESAWEGMYRQMGEFGTRGLNPLARENMGAVFVQMLTELKRIRRASIKQSKVPDHPESNSGGGK